MYDPLKDSTPGCNESYPEHYWAPENTDTKFTALTEDKKSDVVVIGSGFTGLVCAYYLAHEFDRNVILLEANQLAWGCSGRNAGFVLKSTGRLSLADIHRKWGEDIAKGMYDEYQGAVDLLNELIDKIDIDCEVMRKGYLKIAHKPSLSDSLKQQAGFLQKQFGDSVQYIEGDAVKAHINADYAKCALFYPDSFALNPMKLAQGYADLAVKAGVTIHTGSPVINISSKDGKHFVETAKARIECHDVVIATNGYTPKKFHQLLDNRTLPVLSSIIVTEPLTEEQLAMCGMDIGLQVMDTRELKYYYRILPDRRILFGGRGAIQGKNANHPIFKQRLRQGLVTAFPLLADIQVDYFWSGWISVSIDDMPRIWSEDGIHYATGYCGAGVSFTAQAGKRLAQRVVGEKIPSHLPLYNSPLKKFPMAQFRRMGQWGFYQYGRFKDAI